VVYCTLWNAVVVDFQIAAQHSFELGSGCESGLADDLADASVKAIHNAIRLWMAWWDEAMFDVQLLAEGIKDVAARREAACPRHPSSCRCNGR
jgi:hypothetical protein